MYSIDFGSLPQVDKKLNGSEISELNQLFQDSTIQTQLEEIEKQRIIRQKWKGGVYGGVAIIGVVLSYILGTGEDIFMHMVSGFFFTIGSGSHAHHPTIYATIASFSIGMGTLYSKFASKIEIPLKEGILSRMCPLLYSKLEYSHDAKYSFDDIDVLKSKKFLNSFDSIDSVEDSLQFTVAQDGKEFTLNGFELETSEMRGSGNNRQRVTTNHAFLMKVVFPDARIPLTSDLFIVTDRTESVSSITKAFSVVNIILFFVGASLSIGFDTFIPIFIAIIGMVGYGLYQKKTAKKDRVKLENVAFEKLFDVKCDDQVTSRMILNPAFMDRLVQFVEKTGNKYEFLMQNNVMYIKRLITGKYLEAGTEKNMLTNVSGFLDFYTDMREVLMFAFDMNLVYLSNTDTSRLSENRTVTSPPIQFEKVPPLSFIGNFGKKLSGFIGK